MRIKEAREFIERICVQGRVSVSFIPDGDWIRADRCDGDPINIVHEIQIDSGAFQYIYVPKLEDEELYGEWLDRAVSHELHQRKMPYKEYAVLEPINSAGFNIYVCDRSVRLVTDNDNSFEQWSLDAKNNICLDMFVKGPRGVIRDDLYNSKLRNDMVVPEDLHKHPGNTHLHHLDILLPEIEDTYVGDSIYYKLRSSNILIKSGTQWIWVNAPMFLNRMPEPYHAEILLMKSLGMA